MSEENETKELPVIKISGIDFRMACSYRNDIWGIKDLCQHYLRLDDETRGVFSIETSSNRLVRKEYGEARATRYKNPIGEEKNLCQYQLNTHDYVVFDTTNLMKVERFDLEWTKKNLGVTDKGYGVKVSKESLAKIQSKFKEADVLFFSGHHYGDNFHEDYCKPGLLNDGFGETKKWAASFSLQSLFPLLDSNEYPSDCEYNVYNKVKLIVAVGCKYIRRNMFCLYKRLFPNAVVVGYHLSGPDCDNDHKLIKEFFDGMDWHCLLNDSGNDDYKDKIVKAWKDAVNKTWKNSKRWKPGYYYSKNDYNVKIEMEKYWGETLEKRFEYLLNNKKKFLMLESVIPEKFENAPYGICKKIYVLKLKNNELVWSGPATFDKWWKVKEDGWTVNVDEIEKDGLAFLNHGFHYLVDDAYSSEYFGGKTRSDEDEAKKSPPKEHSEVGLVPPSLYVSENSFFSRYPSPQKFKKEFEKVKGSFVKKEKGYDFYQYFIFPEGKLYEMKCFTTIFENDDDITITE